jgi:hypothetical protein
MRNPVTAKEDVYNALNQGLLDCRFELIRRNVGRNRSLIARHGGLQSVVPMLAGRHLLLVAAGPGLDECAGLLHVLAGCAGVRLIAVDAALPSLRQRKLMPDFVITCEAAAHDFLAGAEPAGHLLAFCGAHPSVVRNWKGALSFYNWMMRGEPWDTLWRESGTGLGAVGTGSTVTSQALALALGCGPKSVCLVGNDCAYRHSY